MIEVRTPDAGWEAQANPPCLGGPLPRLIGN